MQNADCLNLLEETIDVCRGLGADEADAVFIQSSDVSVSNRMGKPEDLERAESSGIGIRVFCGNKLAVTSTTDLSNDSIRTSCEQAVLMAKESIEDPYVALAAQELWADKSDDLELYEADEPSIEWMREQCEKAEATALAQQGITNSEGASMHASSNMIALATSKGFAKTYQTSARSFSISLIAGEGDKMERDYDYSVGRYAEQLVDPDTLALKAVRRTLRRMNPKKVSTQSVPVVFDPRVARSLVGTFASAITGSAIARGTSFLKDKMGEKLFADDIVIVDDPHMKKGLGSKPFDAEGVANQKRNIVEGGALQTWLLDIRSANQLGLQTTGHAVRGMSSSPSPSSSNFYMQPGKLSPKELMADIKQGFYVTDTFGMGINLVTGDYSQGASGVWIENGELTYSVSELTIAGHLSDIFAKLTPANDLVFDYSTNAPTLRVEEMMVAGV